MKKATKILVSTLLAVLIGVSVVWYLFVYDRAFTRDTLLGQARFQDLHGNSRLSSWFYDLAYDFSGHDENVAIELANQYKKTGNYTKAEVTLTKAINSEPTVELYTALSHVYVEQDKLLDAVNLLDNIPNPAIKAEIDAQRPTAPESDHYSGYYSQYIDVQLSSTADTIYYTVDGDYPSIAGSVNESAISLPAGESSIYAIGVSKSGLVSPLSVLGYTITGVIEEVSFVDAAMESALRELIGVSQDAVVYTNQLWSIQTFTVPDGATTFSDLELLPYLEKLTLQNRPLDSLTCLSGLSKLNTLDLTGCRFPSADLSILATLPALTSLTLADCSLSTIDSLAGANSLTYLDLSSNTVRNLEALSPMEHLKELHLQHNAINDLSALSGLASLETLNLSFNQVSDLSPLAGCARLNWLDAGNNQLTSLNGVTNLPLLTYLSVEYNALTDVSNLAGCTGLTSLNIGSNDITDISSLASLTKLESFNFSSNKIEALPEWPDGCALQTIDGSYNALSDIDVLQKMQSLTYVYMDYNVLTNIDALANCYCLVQVNVFGNKIADVSALREHDIIVNYDPTVKE